MDRLGDGLGLVAVDAAGGELMGDGERVETLGQPAKRPPRAKPPWRLVASGRRPNQSGLQEKSSNVTGPRQLSGSRKELPPSQDCRGRCLLAASIWDDIAMAAHPGQLRVRIRTSTTNPTADRRP